MTVQRERSPLKTSASGTKPDLPTTELRTPNTALRLRRSGESPETNLLTLAHIVFERELLHSPVTRERKSEFAEEFSLRSHRPL